jgi:hypothetical protein
MILGKISAPFYYPELLRPDAKNRKIRHKNEILNANEPPPYVQIYQTTPKTHYEIS